MNKPKPKQEKHLIERFDDLAKASKSDNLSREDFGRLTRELIPPNSGGMKHQPSSLDSLDESDIQSLDLTSLLAAIPNTKDLAKLALAEKLAERVIRTTQGEIQKHLRKSPCNVVAKGKIKLRFSVQSRQTVRKGVQHYGLFKAEFVDASTGVRNSKQIRTLTEEEKEQLGYGNEHKLSRA
jgi:hypothetical protein